MKYVLEVEVDSKRLMQVTEQQETIEDAISEEMGWVVPSGILINKIMRVGS